MDVNNYTKMKANGCMTLRVIDDDTLLVSCKQFDPNTGEAKEPNKQMFSRKAMTKQVDEQIAALQGQIDSLKEFKDDIEKAAVA